MSNISDNVMKAVQEAATDGRLTCAQAHELSQKLEVNLLVIGQAADELKIKIKACQLGCF